jgi:ribosome-associated protein
MKAQVRVVRREAEKIAVATPEIRLDAFLKLAGAVETGGQAKAEIQAGRVRVNGEACLMRGKKLRCGDVVRYAGGSYAVAENKTPEG